MSVDSSPAQTARPTERPAAATSEWSATPLRPVAHWVALPGENGRTSLTCVWETPNPQPPA